ncbi:MAG: hypothetical protein RLY65_10, partial [Pseudomonadota bacterium]
AGLMAAFFAAGFPGLAAFEAAGFLAALSAGAAAFGAAFLPAASVVFFTGVDFAAAFLVVDFSAFASGFAAFAAAFFAAVFAAGFLAVAMVELLFHEITTMKVSIKKLKQT